MMPSLRQLMAMVARSVQAPREGAAEVLSFGVPREAIPLVIGIVVVLSVILTEITALVSGADLAAIPGLTDNPLVIGVVQLAVIGVTILAVYFIGRAMGGTGSFEETAVLMSWLQFIMICLQVVQTAALLVLPPLGALIGLAAFALFLWLFTQFVAVLHGFRSLGLVFAMIMISGFGIAFVVSLVLVLLGIDFEIPQGEI